MIRQARSGMPLAIGSLTMPVGPSAWLRALIPAVGRTPLLPPSLQPAALAAVPLPTVAMAAHPRQGTTAAGTTAARSERNFRGSRLHRLDLARHLITIHRIADDQTDDWRLLAQMMSLSPAEVQETTFSDDR
jgi:hypothetical protein